MPNEFRFAMKTVFRASLTAAFIAATACGSSTTYGVAPPAGDDGGTDANAAVQVQVMDNRFNPPSLTITMGTTVQWTNIGASPHTVTSGKGSSSSDVGEEFDTQLPTGKTFSHTFNKSGDYPYFCRIHEPNMAASVTVE